MVRPICFTNSPGVLIFLQKMLRFLHNHKVLATGQTDPVRGSLENFPVYFNSNLLTPADGSKSSNTPRTNQQERHRAAGEPARSAMSGWGDGLVSLSFSSRLSIRHKRKTTQNTKAHPEEAQARRQQSKPRQRPQMQGQQEQRAASHTPRSRDRQNSASAAQQARRLPSVDAKPRAASMTRPPTSRLNNHAQSKPTAPKAAPPAAKAVPASTPADRAARLTALSSISSTNLNALFRTRDTPVVAGTPLPAHASTTARVRSVLERNAGDYSRFLPRRVGVRKSASRPPALRTARHALAAQRDVSLAQRRVALHIIGGLAQPRHQVNA